MSAGKRISYELWDLETGNLVGGYDTEEAALAVVRRSIERYGRGSAETLGLARESRGRTRSIAAGASLIERAMAAAAGPTDPSFRRAPAVVPPPASPPRAIPA